MLVLICIWYSTLFQHIPGEYMGSDKWHRVPLTPNLIHIKYDVYIMGFMQFAYSISCLESRFYEHEKGNVVFSVSSKTLRNYFDIALADQSVLFNVIVKTFWSGTMMSKSLPFMCLQYVYLTQVVLRISYNRINTIDTNNVHNRSFGMWK